MSWFRTHRTLRENIRAYQQQLERDQDEKEKLLRRIQQLEQDLAVKMSEVRLLLDVQENGP